MATFGTAEEAHAAHSPRRCQPGEKDCLQCTHFPEWKGAGCSFTRRDYPGGVVMNLPQVGYACDAFEEVRLKIVWTESAFAVGWMWFCKDQRDGPFFTARAAIEDYIMAVESDRTVEELAREAGVEEEVE